MKTNPVFVALNIMFLVVTAGIWTTHGDQWWTIPVGLWVAYIFCSMMAQHENAKQVAALRDLRKGSRR